MEVVLKLLPHQRKVLESTKPYAGLCAGRGSGKSFLLSSIAALALCRGSRVLVTAQNYRSLHDNIFAEIEKRLLEWGQHPQFNHTSMKIMLPNSKGCIFGISYDGIEAVRGYTEIEWAILDEIALAPSNMLETLAPCLRGEGIVPKIRFGSTPRGMSYFNRLIKSKMGDPNWDVVFATTFDNTLLTNESIDLIRGSFTDEAMMQQELYGQLMDGEVKNCILPMHWNFDVPKVFSPVGEIVCGIDFARFGVDDSVITIRDDLKVLETIHMSKSDSYEIFNRWKGLTRQYPINRTILDGTGGYSSGFADLCKHAGYTEVYEMNFGSAPLLDGTCANLRAEIYFSLSKAMAEGFYVANQDVVDELRATSYVINNNGKKAIVPKDGIKEILGHSPDSADSLALTFANTSAIMKIEPVTAEKEARLINTLFR